MLILKSVIIKWMNFMAAGLITQCAALVRIHSILIIQIEVSTLNLQKKITRYSIKSIQSLVQKFSVTVISESRQSG